MCDIKIKLITDYKTTENPEIKGYIQELFHKIYNINLNEYIKE